MDGNLATTYTLIHAFLTKHSHLKAAEAVKKAAKEIVVLKGDIKLDGPQLDEIINQWKSTSQKQESDSSSDSESDSESSSSSSSSDSTLSKKKTVQGKKTITKKPVSSSSSSSSSSESSDSESDAPTPKKTAKKAVVAKATKSSSSSESESSSSSSSSSGSDSDDESSDSSSTKGKKKITKHKAVTPPKTADVKIPAKDRESSRTLSSQYTSSSDSSSEEEEEEESKPAAKISVKSAGKAATTKKDASGSDSSDSSSSESEAENTNTPKNKYSSSSSSSSESSSSDSDSDEESPKKNVDKPTSIKTPDVTQDETQTAKKRRTNIGGDAVVTSTSIIEEPMAKHKGENGKTKRAINERFKRVDPTKFQPIVADNSYVAKVGPENDYGKKANEDLIVTRGAGFRKEKNKKKRGSYRGGEITMTSHSFKFT